MEENKEMVEHPAHYQNGKFETKDLQKIILNSLNCDPYTSLCFGDVIKYLDRFGKKWETTQELDKAKQYLEFCDFKNQRNKIENNLTNRMINNELQLDYYFQLKIVLDCFLMISIGDYTRALDYWQDIRDHSEEEIGLFSGDE